MKPSHIFLGVISFSIFGGINYYLGLRGWQTLGSKIPLLSRPLYWIIFWAFPLCYIIGQLLGRRYLPGIIKKGLTYLGSYWMGAFFYFLLLVVLVDLLRLAGIWTGLLPHSFRTSSAATVTGVTVFLTVALLLVYGTWNARNPIITRYNLDVDKKAGSIESLHITMVSDVHLGAIMNKYRLQDMVDRINALNPDLILFVGDVVDDEVRGYREEKMSDIFKQLRSPYGMYAVPGNHEYISGDINEAVAFLEESGIHVLRDNYIKIADSFYIAGREDVAGERFIQGTRKEPVELLKDINPSLPVILMDHQPVALEKAQAAGVDLQVSGHTHRGQLFPNNLITRKTFELDYGYMKKGSTHFVVSNGFGTWGPPLRIGNKPEVVDIIINFKK